GARQVQDRFGPAAERYALIAGRQKAAAPQRRAAARSAWPRLKHHEAGQIVRFAADTVGDPGPHAGPHAKLRRAGIDEQLGRAVVENVGLDAADDAQVVGHAGQVRQALADLGFAFTVVSKAAARAQQLGILGQESEAFAFHVR